jgi:hypothetical protein
VVLVHVGLFDHERPEDGTARNVGETMLPDVSVITALKLALGVLFDHEAEFTRFQVRAELEVLVHGESLS